MSAEATLTRLALLHRDLQDAEREVRRADTARKLSKEHMDWQDAKDERALIQEEIGELEREIMMTYSQPRLPAMEVEPMSGSVTLPAEQAGEMVERMTAIILGEGEHV